MNVPSSPPESGVPLGISFEFFPPKTGKAEAALWRTVERLAPLAPDFVSVTYGAGGTTRARTHDTVARLVSETGLSTAAHLTCVAATRSEIDAVARQYWDAGIHHIVALRGDPPDGAERYMPTPGGYAYAADLVYGLRDVADFEISVAAYPETHPEAPSAEADLDNEALIAEAYRGIRPAPGYPACPDHTEKRTLFDLLDAERNTGVELTEGWAMWPASSVSGWYFSHPEARYFGVGKIERDQVSDYAARKGMSIEEAERWLSPSLNYEPEAITRDAAE
ncbi:MAG: methylenetetrahydrofolate reductase [Alphaproteobacteria bacterium]|jgi:hypothetical protein